MVLYSFYFILSVGGNEELKKRYGCQVVGPAADAERIPGLDIPLADGASWRFGNVEMRVFDTPGHTKGEGWEGRGAACS